MAKIRADIKKISNKKTIAKKKTRFFYENKNV